MPSAPDHQYPKPVLGEYYQYYQQYPQYAQQYGQQWGGAGAAAPLVAPPHSPPNVRILIDDCLLLPLFFYLEHGRCDGCYYGCYHGLLSIVVVALVMVVTVIIACPCKRRKLSRLSAQRCERRQNRCAAVRPPTPFRPPLRLRPVVESRPHCGL
jgi:hypothetical protein